ncbi:FecR family protein [Pedobacter gandavensis]|uniref:FecR family protein n=1 Tax=Pedobacter gandavensis TaxID=2679963 RepID=UPI00292FA7F6|nr:FecR family protein [Pedobacter gandavensis]
MYQPLLTLEDLITDPTFIDYCLNNNDAATEKWNDYIAQHPLHLANCKAAKTHVLLLTGELPEAYVEARFLEFKLSFDQQNEREQREMKVRKLRSFHALVKMGIAASLVLVSGYLILFSKQEQQHFAFESITGKTISTLLNNRKSVTLGDGTVALLYPGSKLVIAGDYNAKDRKIAVSGQVYLKISPLKDKPFVVYSEHITTTALGTSFFVRDFKDNEESFVYLMTGSVKVKQPELHKSMMLEPGTSLVVNNKTGTGKKGVFNEKELEEMSLQQLILNNEDMAGIVRKLQLFYGVEIDLSKCDCEFKRITGDYSKVPLAGILNTISYINQLDWQLKDNKIVFRPDPKKK